MVRREAIKTLIPLAKCNNELGFDALHRAARKDLDWEVRELALHYWEWKLDELLENFNPHGNFSTFLQQLDSSYLSRALEVDGEDFDEKRRLHKLYKCHQKLRDWLVMRFDTEIKNLSNIKIDLSSSSRRICLAQTLSMADISPVCDFDSCLANPNVRCEDCSKPCPVAKLVFASLDEDLDERCHQYAEYHGVVHRLTSVLEDIIQSQKPENAIDLIDCF